MQIHAVLFVQVLCYLLKLYKALDICTITEKKLVITGRDTGATSAEFADYLMSTIEKL